MKLELMKNPGYSQPSMDGRNSNLYRSILIVKIYVSMVKIFGVTFWGIPQNLNFVKYPYPRQGWYPSNSGERAGVERNLK